MNRNFAIIGYLALFIAVGGCGGGESDSTDAQSHSENRVEPGANGRRHPTGSTRNRTAGDSHHLGAHTPRSPVNDQPSDAIIAATGDNWPRFRGLQGAGHSNAKGLPTSWSATKNIVWKLPLPGPGASSPIVWGSHVYVTCFTGYGISPQSPGDKADLKRHLLCVHRDTGRVLWKKTVDGGGVVHPGTGHQELQAHGYASHTPAADESGVYVYFGPSGVFAYTHAGRLRWQKACGKKTDHYGSCMSPILYHDLLIVNADVECGSLIAFDRNTGEEKWRRGKNKMPGTAATPAVLTLNGKEQLVYCDAPYGSIAALDPLKGTTLWRGSLRISRVNACPLALGDMLFFSGNPVSRSAAIQIGSKGPVKELWSLNKGAYISSPIYYDGHFYWAKEQGGVVYCVEAKTGTLKYETRLRPHSGHIYSSPVLVEDRIYYVSQTRGTFVVAANPKFKLISHNVIDTDKSIFNGSPAVSGGRLFLRSNKFLYCIGRRQ